MENKYCEYYKKLLYEKTGISIAESKENLIQIKLQRIMRRKQIDSYHDYYKLLKNESNTDEVQEFIDTFTTNTTEFFRESNHFDYLIDNINHIFNSMPRIKKNNEIRVWCAASSTGQEPVTLAMVLRDCLPENINIKLLATDISSRVLKKAGTGFYTFEEVKKIPKYYLEKYFEKCCEGYYVKYNIMEIIKYRHFNLMEDFNFKHTFDIIFCRNVMIYFDHEMQQKLVDKFYQNMTDGGVFIVGNSESLISKQHNFTTFGPSIYRK